MKIFNYTVIFVLIVMGWSCSQQPAEETLFNKNWQFTISDAAYAQITDYDQWEDVSLPHTPVITPKVMQGQWQGICWYKKTFELKPSSKSQRKLLRFEGAMNVSEYWINGQKVFEHIGGYLPAVFDFTDFANIGENTIYVKLNNQDNQITGPKPMHRLDFNMHGGLYRDAFLILKNQLHITDPILEGKTASGGIFVTYSDVSEESANVKVQTHIRNSDSKEMSFEVIHEIWKENELITTSDEINHQLNGGDDMEIISKMLVKEPDLWSPDSPDLYQLKTKLLVKGKLFEEQSTKIGIRHIAFTENQFYLNGQKLQLRGVNRHQEYPYIGYALSNAANYRDAKKIKDAGFNYIRLSHYPHSPAFMDACNELGILVLDAILGWQYYSKDSLFQQQIYRTAHDLIRRDRNHPCVLAWEVSLNESWMDEYFIDELTSIAHAEYPGDQCFTAGWQEYGYEIYLQARQHRLQHYKEPDKPYSVSEYGDWEYYAQNAGLNQDTWGNLKQEDRSSRQLLSDGEIRLLQQATNVQEAHNDNFNTPAFSDSYWVMYDYNRGYADDLEASGLASIDRIPKFSYYFFQSQRDPQHKSDLYDSGPMVYIATWWTEKSPLDVRIYSNAEEVELLLNGNSLGIQKPDQNRMADKLNHPPFTFNLEKFEAGMLEAKAYINGKQVAYHSTITPEVAYKLSLELDESGIMPVSNTNDVLFVHAKIKDQNNSIVRINNYPIEFSLSGDAEIISPVTVTSEVGYASAMIKIGDKNEPITISVKSQNLKPSKISFIPM